MKILKLILIFIFFFGIINGQLYSQTTPPGFSYQAIARDDLGKELLNAPVMIRFGIHSGSFTGPLEYQETHTATTNQFGLFTLVIGMGTRTGGNKSSFAEIEWNRAFQFLSVELSLDGGGNFIQAGSTQFLTVPYAMASQNLAGSPGGITIPSGPTSERTNTPTTGTTRFNTDLSTMEVYNGTVWININTPAIGATYVQWFNAAAPNVIYPNTTWVSSDFDGEFIRALGTNSNPMNGTVQQHALQDHGHALGGSTTPSGGGGLTTPTSSSHDHGGNTGFFDVSHDHPTKRTGFDGAHSHNFTVNNGGAGGGSNIFKPFDTDPNTTTNTTSLAPSHNHILDVDVALINTSNLSLNHLHTIPAATNTQHTIPDHLHNYSVDNVAGANAADETRPINKTVIFWRRTQ